MKTADIEKAKNAAIELSKNKGYAAVVFSRGLYYVEEKLDKIELSCKIKHYGRSFHENSKHELDVCSFQHLSFEEVANKFGLKFFNSPAIPSGLA